MAIEGNTGSTSLMTGTFNFLPCDDLVGIPLALHPVSFREFVLVDKRYASASNQRAFMRMTGVDFLYQGL
jgi:hypothetical protein